MADPIPLRPGSPPQSGTNLPNPSDPLTAFDRFIAVYPKQYQIGRARRVWQWAVMKAGDHDKVIEGAVRARAYYTAQAANRGWEFVPGPAAWLENEGWLDTYELPQPPPQPAHDRREALRASAAKGNRFSADLLKRDYGE